MVLEDDLQRTVALLLWLDIEIDPLKILEAELVHVLVFLTLALGLCMIV